MKLCDADVELFYKLHRSLLFYVNKRFRIVGDLNSRDDIKKLPPPEINKLRERLYQRPELIDSFVDENPFNFSPEELTVIKSWKDFVMGKFFIFRYLEDHTIFFQPGEPPKAYGVLALTNPLEEIVGPYLPVMVDAVLLPFRGKIIYDGIFTSYSITFGGGVRRSLNDEYQETKSRFGIITSLPFIPKEVEQTDADKLRFYLRSERTRERYREEIEGLISGDTKLLALYHQKMGKIHARTCGKQLRELGLKEGWFAILEGITVASGASREEVEQVLERIPPSEKREFVYIFHLKGGSSESS